MKLTHSTILALTAFLSLPAVGNSASDIPFAIETVSSFDYPAAGRISTTAVKIDDRNEIVGHYFRGIGPVMGFIRYKGGNFSPPIIEPNDNGNFTAISGISDRVGCGRYFTVPDNIFHGFVLKGGIFTTFDVGGPVSTVPQDINQAGDIAGYFYDSTGVTTGFVTIDGVTTSITIPDSTFVLASGINQADEVVGYFLDSAFVIHGFFRDAAGDMQYPIDFPGAASTEIQDINDRGQMVGIYRDSADVGHGYFFAPPSTFLSYDYPFGKFTTFNGINNTQIISGYYNDPVGARHGLEVRVTPHPPR